MYMVLCMGQRSCISQIKLNNNVETYIPTTNIRYTLNGNNVLRIVSWSKGIQGLIEHWCNI